MHIPREAEKSTTIVVNGSIYDCSIALTMFVDVLLHKRKHTMSMSGLVAMQYVHCSYSAA